MQIEKGPLINYVGVCNFVTKCDAGERECSLVLLNAKVYKQLKTNLQSFIDIVLMTTLICLDLTSY